MKLRIEITGEDAELVAQVLEATRGNCFNSHGPLDIQRLAQVMLQDVALTVRRPGSWEGANMRQVLRSHDFEV